MCAENVTASGHACSSANVLYTVTLHLWLN